MHSIKHLIRETFGYFGARWGINILVHSHRSKTIYIFPIKMISSNLNGWLYALSGCNKYFLSSSLSIHTKSKNALKRHNMSRAYLMFKIELRTRTLFNEISLWNTEPDKMLLFFRIFKHKNSEEIALIAFCLVTSCPVRHCVTCRSGSRFLSK